MKFILIYTTNPDLKTARRIADNLLKSKLIACANFFPVKSAYRWKGKIEHGREIVAILKTSKGLWKRVKREVVKVHPYETPCILKIETEANEEFAAWITGETAQQKK